MSDRYDLSKYNARARSKIRAVLIVLIFALGALLVFYYLTFRDSALGPPPLGRELSEKEKLEVLAEIGDTNQSQLTLEERQEILDQLVESSPKRN